MTTDLQKIEKQLLDQRAESLAAPLEEEGQNEEVLSILRFQSMGSVYAVDLTMVDAVTKITDIFHIPLTPSHISGVIRRRGRTTALVNLRFFFYPGSESLVDEDYAVIVRVKNKSFALQVEEIDGVFPVPTAHVLPVPDSYDRAQAPYISGVTMDGLSFINLPHLVLAEGFGTSKIED